MKKWSQEDKEKVKAGLELLCENNTSWDKISKISTLLTGLNPKTDKYLKNIAEISEKLKLVSEGEVLILSADKLPEKTQKQKKYRKLLLLLLTNWKTLQGEVARINAMQTAATATGIGKIVATAKGPLGLITIAAAGIVAVNSFLNAKAVEITVNNNGCRPLGPISEQVINLPGLKLPKGEIKSGSSEKIIIPGIDLTVGLNSGQVDLTTWGLSKNFGIPGEIKEVEIDGQKLMGKVIQLKLGEKKEHTVTVRCN